MEMDLLQLNQLRETVDHLKKENRTLVKENESFVDQIKELKLKRKDLEYELVGILFLLRPNTKINTELSRMFREETRNLLENMNMN